MLIAPPAEADAFARLNPYHDDSLVHPGGFLANMDLKARKTPSISHSESTVTAAAATATAKTPDGRIRHRRKREE